MTNAMNSFVHVPSVPRSNSTSSSATTSYRNNSYRHADTSPSPFLNIEEDEDEDSEESKPMDVATRSFNLFSFNHWLRFLKNKKKAKQRLTKWDLPTSFSFLPPTSPPPPMYTRPLFLIMFIALVLGTLVITSWMMPYSIFTNPFSSSASSVTIILSIDGFRADYLRRGLTPSFMQFAQQGVMADYLVPSFPTLTYPNHYTLVTGLYPSEHGIVSNIFYDPELKLTFNYTNPDQYLPSYWWGGEPIWVTAAKHEKLSGMYHWVGSASEILGHRPTYWEPYQEVPLSARFDPLLTWLSYPDSTLNDNTTTTSTWSSSFLSYLWSFSSSSSSSSFFSTSSSNTEFIPAKRRRPHLIGGYIPDLDHTGHQYGPDSKELNSTLIALDQTLATFLHALKQFSFPIQFIIVSDHGMGAATEKLSLEEWLGPWKELVEVRFYGPLVCLDPKRVSDRMLVYKYLKSKLNQWSMHSFETKKNNSSNFESKKEKAEKPFEVYLKEEVPPELHYSNHSRIASIIVIPENGYQFLHEKEELVPGMHGYRMDTTHEMNAVFMAMGPAFENVKTYLHRNKQSLLSPFPNIEIYNLLCHLLGIPPAKNSGKGLPWLKYVRSG